MSKQNRFGQAAVISDKDYRKIRKFLNKKQRMLLDIAWYTGERWGALVQLRVSDVYSAPGVPRKNITFRASTRKASPDGKRETRQVPMHPQLAEALSNYKAPLNGWLFPSRLDADEHLTLRGAAWSLGKAVVKAGLSQSGISTHSTRRAFITHLHEKGCDIKTIQAVTGHKDLKALQRYVEVTPDRVVAAIALLD